MKFNPLRTVMFLIPFGINCAFAQRTQQTSYDFNRAPLKQGVYVQLPLGSIKAKGWLLKQLELQKEGFTGHAEELYPEKENLGAASDWLGGSGNGWERVPYYLKGLVALAYTLDDADLKTKAQKWIDYTLDHQQENGLFGPEKMKDWWPRMPFMYAVQSYYEATNDKRVIPFLTKYLKYELANLDKEPLKEWGKSRAGDNIELALWVYNKTGEKYLLDLAAKLKDQAYPWADIFTKNQFFYFGADYQPRHVVNVSQALKFPVLYSLVDPSPQYTEAMQTGIGHLMRDHGQPEGMAAGTERLSGRSSVEGVETCAVVEWMQSLETAARVIHEAGIGDQLEKTAFNALPAQFSRDLKNHAYYTLPNQVQSLPGRHGFDQDYSSGIVLSPYSGFPCCRYNMHMGWPYFVKNSWLATPDGGLAVVAYGPMDVNAVVEKDTPVKIEETTAYPFEEKISLTITLAKKASFPLRLRIPSWCWTPEVKLNGKVMKGVKPGGVFTMARKWSNGDKVELNFPMKATVQKQVNNAVSIERGPLVYALKINPVESNVKAFPVKGFFETQIAAASPWNYGLVTGSGGVEKSITVIKKPMPDNPFLPEETPVQLLVKAKRLPSWTLNDRKTAALDVPVSPVASNEKTEDLTLIPFGSENIRLSIFPTIGKPAFISTAYTESFSANTAAGWVNYGIGWFCRDGAVHTASNEDKTSGGSGSKLLATATNFSDFVYSADVAVHSSGDAGLVFRVSDPAIGPQSYKGYYVGLNPGTGKVELGKAKEGQWIVIASAQRPLKLNETYTVKVKTVGERFDVFLNGEEQPVITATDNEYKTGSIGLRAYKALATMDNINVTAQ